MRITHIITRLIIGGAQENTIASVLGLADIPGFEVDLVSGPTHGSEGSLESTFSRKGAPRLTVIPNLIRPVSPWNDIQALLELEKLLKAERPDIVHTHSGKAGFLGRMAARRAGVPLVLHTIHGPSFGDFQGRLGNWLFKTAEQVAGRYTDHFVTVAQAMTEMSLGAGIKRPEDYTRIFSGFELGNFLTARRDESIRERLGIGQGDFVIGKLARLAPLKGHMDLLDAAPLILKRIPSARFLFIGDGDLKESIRQRAQALGVLDQVRFTGLVPPQEVPILLAQMDVLVHLSRREGLARALPQAMAVGLPILAYDCDGAGEVCIDDQTGYLIRTGDSSGMAAKLVQLAESPELRRRLGEAGRAKAAELFPVKVMVNQLASLYRKLWDQRSPTLRRNS